MARSIRRLGIIGLALGCLAPTLTLAQKPEAASPETPGLRATQVTIAIEKDRKSRRFRATVMARKDDSLVVLTAAHCLSVLDEDGPALLLLEGEVVEGRVVSVVRNPAYQPNQKWEVAGPDNAVARLRFRPSSKASTQAFESLRPAVGLTSRTYPGPGGQTVFVRMIDGHGVEHALKAGNYSNPRWLEWGPSYKPIPGDSGAGVFVMSGSSGGEPRPILIGILVGQDDRGGVASLVSKDMRWIADELVR